MGARGLFFFPLLNEGMITSNKGTIISVYSSTNFYLCTPGLGLAAGSCGSSRWGDPSSRIRLPCWLRALSSAGSARRCHPTGQVRLERLRRRTFPGRGAESPGSLPSRPPGTPGVAPGRVLARLAGGLPGSRPPFTCAGRAGRRRALHATGRSRAARLREAAPASPGLAARRGRSCSTRAPLASWGALLPRAGRCQLAASQGVPGLGELKFTYRGARSLEKVIQKDKHRVSFARSLEPASLRSDFIGFKVSSAVAPYL